MSLRILAEHARSIAVLISDGVVPSNDLRGLLNHWLVRLVMFFLISLSLFHAVHRIRFILVDLGLHAARGLIATLCYGFAVIGTLVALLVVTGLWK